MKIFIAHVGRTIVHKLSNPRISTKLMRIDAHDY